MCDVIHNLSLLSGTVDRVARQEHDEDRMASIWSAICSLKTDESAGPQIQGWAWRLESDALHFVSGSEPLGSRHPAPVLIGAPKTTDEIFSDKSVCGLNLPELGTITHLWANLRNKWPSARSHGGEFLTDKFYLPIFNRGKLVGMLMIRSYFANKISNSEVSRFLAPYAGLFGTCIPSVDSNKESLVSLISHSRHKQVLILGKDNGPEFDRLLAVARIVMEMGYMPLLVKQHPDIPELSNEEKVRVFADHARFVICEDSVPSGHIAELKMITTNRMITATLREKGKGSSYMVVDYPCDYPFINAFDYTQSEASLRRAVGAACQWAERKIKERIDLYNSLYPWRRVNQVSISS